jgi:hypothetical protein
MKWAPYDRKRLVVAYLQIAVLPQYLRFVTPLEVDMNIIFP